MKTTLPVISLLFLLVWQPVQSQWTQTSGPLVGGSIRAFAVSGTTLFAAADNEGGNSFVYRSTDDGRTWARVFASSFIVHISSLAAFGSEVFLGNSSGDVFLSTNEGATWLERGGVGGIGVATGPVISLAFFDDEAGSTTLLAGTDGTGIYRSTDKGLTWVEANTGLPLFNLLVVNCFEFCGKNVFAGLAGLGLFVSTDLGASWTPVGDMQYFFVNALALLLDAGGGAHLFAGTDHGVLRSTDRGTNWDWVPGLWTTYISAFVVSGSNLFAGTDTGGVFLSTNYGTSWDALNTGLTNKSVLAMAVSADSQGNTNLFAGTRGGGVFCSTNGGMSWGERNTGLVYSDVWSVTLSGTNLFAGTYHDGVFLSTDDGASWKAVNAGLTNSSVTALACSGQNLFAGTNGSGVYRSTDSAASWAAVNEGLPQALVVYSLAVSPRKEGGANLIAGTAGEGIYYSTDNGTSWPGIFGAYNGSDVRLLACSGATLFALTSQKGIVRSMNNGTDWEITNNGPAAWSYVRSLAVSPEETGGLDVFAGMYDGNLFVSTDSGTSWNAGPFLTNDDVSALVCFSRKGGGINLVAGTGDGAIFLSADRGATWYEAGRINNRVRSFAVSDKYLFGATWGGGVWKRSLSELVTGVDASSTWLPSAYRLDQNFPNPFNPSTTIPFALPHSSHVTLSVYNTLGQLASTLVNGEQEAGYHEVKFDGTYLASGVYFYRLQAGTFVQTRKLLFLR